MSRRFADSAGKGHRIGGLFLLGALAFGCVPAEGPQAGPGPSLRFTRPLELYRDLGLITGTADFAAVASITTLAGPADSTYLLLGLSMPTSALRFQREETGFVARYVVTLRAVRDSQRVAAVDRHETVRVHGFAETARTEESVLFQTGLTLGPGEYRLSLRVRDGLSARGFEAIDTVEVPAYGAGGRAFAPPVPVFTATARTDRGEKPTLVLNPRHTVAYGDAAPLLYVEAYDSVPVRVSLRADGVEVWGRDTAGTAVVALPGDSLPMGRLTVVAAAGGDSAEVPLVVTLTDRWVVSNFEEVADILGYIASTKELAALREASPEERRHLWDHFWEARDPVPATPGNEYRDEFFDRVRAATLQFGEPGRAGWRTDRGEVYIVLGPPSRAMELRYESALTPEPQAVRWVYQRVPGGGRLGVVFVDRNGFGTFRLTQASELEFRAVARRIKNRDRR